VVHDDAIDAIYNNSRSAVNQFIGLNLFLFIISIINIHDSIIYNNSRSAGNQLIISIYSIINTHDIIIYNNNRSAVNLLVPKRRLRGKACALKCPHIVGLF
jgi:hypothetical protein